MVRFREETTADWGDWLLFALTMLGAVALILALSGCASNADAMPRTWERVREHAFLTAADRDALDEAAELDAERPNAWGQIAGWGLELLGLGVPTAGAAVVATNRIRDRRRRLRGEPVNPEPKA